MPGGRRQRRAPGAVSYGQMTRTHPHPARVTAVALGRFLIDRLEVAIRDARRRSALGPVTVITPTLYSAYFLREELAASGPGLFNVNFLRLDDLAERLLPAGRPRRPLSRVHAAELVYAVATQRKLPELLKPLRGHESFHRALHRSFDDLRNLPQTMLDAVALEGEIAGTVVRLWQSYQQSAASFEDRLEVARAAAQAVESNPVQLKERFGLVILTLIEDPAPQYRPLLDALLGLAETEVIVGLVSDATADARVVSAAGIRGSEVKAAQPGEVSTTLVTAPDRSEEVRWVVRNVLRLARCGTRLGRIAVVYEDPSYGPRVDDALRIAGIPVSGPDPHLFRNTPEGRFLDGLIQAAAELSRDKVMAWLTGAPVKSPDGRTPMHAARWDAVSRNAGVTRGLDVWRTKLIGYGKRLRRRADAGERAGELDAARTEGMRVEAREAEALLAFVEQFSRDAEPPLEASSWSALTGWLRDLMGRYMASTESESGERTERVHKLLERLESLGEVKGPPPTLERFRSVLREELDQPLRTMRRLGRGVFVAPLRQAVGTWFEAVHVLGMSEGRYPASALQDPLLPDSLRSNIDASGEVLPTRSQSRDAARRHFLTALASAGKRFLLWPRCEDGGARPGSPSQWFVEEARKLEALIAGREVSRLQAGQIATLGREWLVHVGSMESAIADGNESELADDHEYRLRSIARWTAAGKPPDGHFLASAPDGIFASALRLESGRDGWSWTQWDGNLSSKPPMPAEERDKTISPTRLETWAACPFRYFLSYVLDIRATEKPEEIFSLSPLDRGTLIHEILERFVNVRRELVGKGEDPDQDEQERMIVGIAREEFSRTEKEGVTGKPALWAIEKARIERELITFIEKDLEHAADSGQQPVAAELRFGSSAATLPAVEVDLPGVGRVRFSGVIDRLDANATRSAVTVIDYKTGRTDDYSAINADPVDRGRRLQLPIYALAARAYLGEPDAVDSFYWFVSEAAGFRTYGQSLADSDGPMRAAASVIVDGIRKGIFPAHPGDPRRDSTGIGANCRNCPFSDRVCPQGRLRLWEMKRAEPALHRYLALTKEATA